MNDLTFAFRQLREMSVRFFFSCRDGALSPLSAGAVAARMHSACRAGNSRAERRQSAVATIFSPQFP
jgi:hypothetical protein